MMKRLIHINEYLIKKKLDKVRTNYTYVPKTKEELKDNIKELLDKGETDLNCIDTSNITDMSYLFNNLNTSNKDINVSDWNISNVKNMKAMFNFCKSFTGNGLENWNVSKVENMDGMFCGCEKFDCDLSNWDVSNVEDMSSMFMYCFNFTGKGLENWNISNVKDMYGMFFQCEKFDCDLSNWDVSKIKEMNELFKFCKSFKGKGLEKWNVSNVENMHAMFFKCDIFNCDISNWNIRKVEDMSLMFLDCKNFDCDLEKWNISKASYGSSGHVNTYDMFDGCASLKNTPSWYRYKK